MGVGVWHAKYLKMTAGTREVHQETKSTFLFLVVIYTKSQIVLLDVFFVLFTSIANKIWSAYCPNAVVVQCGADCINGDPAFAFNLTPRGIGLCIKKILAWNLPTLFLGGGTVKLLNN